jgi:thiol-disulfide isomerase/thioredoxin
VGVVVVAVAVALGTVRESGSRPSLEEVAGDPVVAGSDLGPFGGDTAADPAVGDQAPTVTGADFAGDPVAVGTGEGPELVVFLASWCPHCQAELPELVGWLEAGGLPDGVRLTAVVTGLDPRRPNWPPQAWLDAEGYRGAVLVDDAEGRAAAAFGLSGTPFWVALDGDGTVVARAAGAVGMEAVAQLASMARNG